MTNHACLEKRRGSTNLKKWIVCDDWIDPSYSIDQFQTLRLAPGTIDLALVGWINLAHSHLEPTLVLMAFGIVPKKHHAQEHTHGHKKPAHDHFECVDGRI
ncbi:hypothetical protein ACJX0J_007393 [Zea mays]